MVEPHTERPRRVPRRRFLQSLAAFAGISLTESAVAQSPAQQETNNPEKSISVEKWTSEVRQTLASFNRPLADESEQQLYDLLDLVFPFLMSNAAVPVQNGNELWVKCYVNGPLSGKDIGDNQIANPERRIYEIFLVSNPTTPNRSSMTIRTSESPVALASIADNNFNPDEYPFDLNFSFFTFQAAITRNNVPSSDFNKEQEVIITATQDLFDGEIVAPPVPFKPESNEKIA